MRTWLTQTVGLDFQECDQGEWNSGAAKRRATLVGALQEPQPIYRVTTKNGRYVRYRTDERDRLHESSYGVKT